MRYGACQKRLREALAVLVAWAAGMALLGPALVVAADSPAPESPAKKQVLLLAQKPDTHPPSTHEYLAGMRILAACLKNVPQVSVAVVEANSPWPEGPELISRADCVAIFLTEGARWVTEEPRRLDAFARHAAAGRGLAAIHWGMGTREAEPIAPFVALFGGCHGGPDRKHRVFKDCQVIVAEDHPSTAGIESFRIAEEEFYYRLKLAVPQEQAADGAMSFPVRARIDGVDEPVSWAWTRPDGGRSFGFSGGHFHANWRVEAYRRLMAQAVLWTCKLPAPPGGLSVDLPEEAYELK